jgi:formylglycine-generating enzyme required for sulfatase activity
MRFRLCMPGRFLMGDANGSANEKPVHEIAITAPFYIAEHEVTNDQWKRVMGGLGRADAHPVNQVSWQEATEYCRRLSALPAEQESRRIYRLPTEAEWEYACRAGSKTRYFFGDDAGRLGEYAWFSGNSGRQWQAVGQRRANPWGLYDMHGNVWEWVSDPYGNYPRDDRPRDNQPGRGMNDTQFDATVSRRVIRGGGCLNSAGSCRSTIRQGLEPSIRDADLGFRVAWTAPDDARPEPGR